MRSMQPSIFILRLKQALMGLAGLGIAAVFILPPLMAKDYPERQGVFQAEILSSASGMGLGGKPVLPARVEDVTGRIFWVSVPSTMIVSPGRPLVIETWCQTTVFDSCTARYQRAGPLP